LRRVSPGPEVVLFTRKKLNKQISGKCSEWPPKVSTSTVVVTPHHLPPDPSISSSVKTPETQKRTLMTLNQQMKEICSDIF